MASAHKSRDGLPTGYEDALYTHTAIVFGWRDRLKILLGYKVEIRTQTYCEHAPGSTANGETRLSVYRERSLPKGWGYAEANTATARAEQESR